MEIELRGAIEPWNVLGEESTAGGTARYVDSSVERIQVRLIGADRQRYVVTCNGYPVPLRPTDNPGRPGRPACGYRAWQPPSALHPTITVDTPLLFDLVDTGHRHVRGGCTYHVSHPGGRSYDTPPVNAMEAESRRGRRFEATGSPRATSTCPTSARSRPASPPMSARRASWICAGCVPFCS